MGTLPIGDPDPQSLTFLLDQLPGGVHIKPHAEDGPWWIVAVTSWDEPNWQLQACLAAYPGVEAPAELQDTGGPLSFHIVPDFVRRMCEWHTAEYEANVETDDEYAAGPFDTRPGADVLQRHIDALVAEEA